MKKTRFLQHLLIALCWLLVWQAASYLAGSELLLPSPLSTLKSLMALITTALFWKSAAFTLLRVIGGFLLGLAAGTVLGVLTSAVRLLDAFLSPLKSIIKATPVTSFIILVLLWLTTGVTPMFIAFLMVLPIIWTNVYEGIRNTDPQLIEMANLFRFSNWKKIRYIYTPSVLPYYLAACTTSLGFAWKAGVTAEVLASPAFSIGKSIYESKLYLETPELFAWTAVVVIMSIVLERVVVAALERLKKW